MLRGVVISIRRDGTKGPGFPIKNGETLFGRDKEADVRIKINSVSRKHCKIIADEKCNMTLLHLSNTNPTFLNGKPIIGSAELKDGDEINMGDRIFILKQTRVNRPKISSSLYKYRQVLETIEEGSDDDENDENEDENNENKIQESSDLVEPQLNMKELQEKLLAEVASHYQLKNKGKQINNNSNNNNYNQISSSSSSSSYKPLLMSHEDSEIVSGNVDHNDDDDNDDDVTADFSFIYEQITATARPKMNVTLKEQIHNFQFVSQLPQQLEEEKEEEVEEDNVDGQYQNQKIEEIDCMETETGGNETNIEDNYNDKEAVCSSSLMEAENENENKIAHNPEELLLIDNDANDICDVGTSVQQVKTAEDAVEDVATVETAMDVEVEVESAIELDLSPPNKKPRLSLSQVNTTDQENIVGDFVESILVDAAVDCVRTEAVRGMVADLTNQAVKKNVEGVARSSMARGMVADLTNQAVKRTIDGLMKASVTIPVSVPVVEITEKEVCIEMEELNDVEEDFVPVTEMTEIGFDEFVHQQQSEEKEVVQTEIEVQIISQSPVAKIEIDEGLEEPHLEKGLEDLVVETDITIHNEESQVLEKDEVESIVEDSVIEKIETDVSTEEKELRSEFKIDVAAPLMEIVEIETCDMETGVGVEVEASAPIVETAKVDPVMEEVESVFEALITKMVETEILREVEIIVDILVTKTVDTEISQEVMKEVEYETSATVTEITEINVLEEQQQQQQQSEIEEIEEIEVIVQMEAPLADITDTNLPIEDVLIEEAVELEATISDVIIEKHQHQSEQEVQIEMISKDKTVSSEEQEEVEATHNTVVTEVAVEMSSDEQILEKLSEVEEEEEVKGQLPEKKVEMKLNTEIETEVPVSDSSALVSNSTSPAPVNVRRSKRVVVDTKLSQNDEKEEREEEIIDPPKRIRKTRSSSRKQKAYENDVNEKKDTVVEIQITEKENIESNQKKSCKKKTSSKPKGKKEEGGEGEENATKSSKAKASSRKGQSKRKALGEIEHDMNIVEESINSSQPVVRRSARIRSQ